MEAKRGETARLVCETFGAKPVAVEWLRQNALSLKWEPINLDYVAESFSFPRYTALEKNYDTTFNTATAATDFGSIAPVTRDNGVPGWKSLPYVNNNRTLFELHINSVVGSDTGHYACKASNEFGEDFRSINLFVQDVPATVRKLLVDQIWSRDVSVSWMTPESMGNSALTQYIVQYWKEIAITPSPSTIGSYYGKTNTSVKSGHRLHEIEIAPTETSCIIKNLTPGTSYVIRVVAVNSFGRGMPTPPTRFITAEEAPNASPIDITTEQLGTTELKVRWKAPPKSHWNGELRGYYLGYRVVADKSSSTEAGKQASHSHAYMYKEVPFSGTPLNNYQEECLLTGLDRSTTYR